MIRYSAQLAIFLWPGTLPYKNHRVLVILGDYVCPLFRSGELKTPGGYLQKNWVVVCGPLHKTLTLFMTKIYDIPYPIYELTP